MKARYRNLFSMLLVAILAVQLAIPVFAAKPKLSGVGLLMIATGQDLQNRLAVSVREEDGTYIYSGYHPIQQQNAAYITLTDAGMANSAYSLVEDEDYDTSDGVYRFKQGEASSRGAQADIPVNMASVKKGDVVYFVSYDENAGFFETEKSVVSSIKKEALTTKDDLEDNIAQGDFAVIFNDDGELVGFCKSGDAWVLMPPEGFQLETWMIAAGVGAVVLIAVIAVVLVMNSNKKKKTSSQQFRVAGGNSMEWQDEATQLDDPGYSMDSGFPMDNSLNAGGSLVLICRGGYQNGRRYPIPKNGITIGRAQDNRIVYPAQTPGVSRHHVRVFWNEGQMVLLDLGSSNGTYLNNQGKIPVMHPVPLKVGDVFYLGEKKNAFEVTTQ